MTPSEWREKQAKDLVHQKNTPVQRISNNFIDNAINRNNAQAIKIIFYISSLLKDFNFDLELDVLTIDMKEMFKYTALTAQETRNNLKAMQETSITFINEDEMWEEYIILIPKIKFYYGKNKIEIYIFSKIAKLIVEVQKNFTQIDVKALMVLKSKHTLRMLPLLEKIKGYDSYISKRKTMSLNALNDFFGTNYKTIYEIERRILDPIKNELEKYPLPSFIYQVNTDSFGRGRPKAVSVTIDLILREQYYLSSKKIFISYMRNSYIGKNILEGVDKETNKPIVIYISTHGKLYDRKSGDSFTAKRANELWDTLYQLAKDKKLNILKK